MGRKTQRAIELCPFVPGDGGFPPHLAGREQEQDSLADHINYLAADASASSALIIYGPRGNGKTVLLDWTRHRAEDCGVNAVRPSSQTIKNRSELTEKLLAALRWSWMPQTIAWRGVQVRFGQYGSTSIENALRRLTKKRPVALLIDEAHSLDPDVGASLLHAVQLLRADGLATLLVLAGTPDLPINLRRMQATFWEHSTVLSLQRLDPAASADAIRIPFEATNRSVSPEALVQVARESHGYPFFLQLWGRVLWNRAEGRAASHRIGRRRPGSSGLLDL